MSYTQMTAIALLLAGSAPQGGRIRPPSANVPDAAARRQAQAGSVPRPLNAARGSGVCFCSGSMAEDKKC